MSEDTQQGEEIMKSALEIALEKTQDIQAQEDPHQLTSDEKQQVRVINQEFDARIAELELEFSRRIRQIAEEHGQEQLKAHLPMFDQELRTARDTINSERQDKIQAYYASIGKS